MPYRLNVFSGNLDYYQSGGGGSGNVTGESPTTVNSITRWDNTTGTLIKNSPGTIVQDSGAIEAQGFITNRNIAGTIVINPGETWLAPSLNIQPGSVIVLNADSQLIVV